MQIMNHMVKRGYIWMSYHVCKEEFEDTKGVIRIRKSKKNRQRNDQKKNYKRTNNDLQNIHIKLNSDNTNPLKTGGELMCSGRVISSCSTNVTRRVNLVTILVISHECKKGLGSIYNR
jgi:hypothetical protein